MKYDISYEKITIEKRDVNFCIFFGEPSKIRITILNLALLEIPCSSNVFVKILLLVQKSLNGKIGIKFALNIFN